jgi:hypothetical protein
VLRSVGRAFCSRVGVICHRPGARYVGSTYERKSRVVVGRVGFFWKEVLCVWVLNCYYSMGLKVCSYGWYGRLGSWDWDGHVMWMGGWFVFQALGSIIL